jgi:hypothetical protein
MFNESMKETVRKIAIRLRDEDCKRLGWRRVAVWAYYRDRAINMLYKSPLITKKDV